MSVEEKQNELELALLDLLIQMIKEPTEYDRKAIEFALKYLEDNNY